MTALILKIAVGQSTMLRRYHNTLNLLVHISPWIASKTILRRSKTIFLGVTFVSRTEALD
jgi:hypothetical protein